MLGGGKVASFGTDSFRRSVRLTTDALAGPSKPNATNLFGERTTVRTGDPAPIVKSKDDLGLFAGTDGLVGQWRVLEPSTARVGNVKLLTAAGRDPASPALVGYQLGKGIVVRVGVPRLGGHARPGRRRGEGDEADMGAPLALAPALPSAGIVVAALAVAGVFAMPGARERALSAIAALIVAPLLLVGELWDNSSIVSLRDHPALAAVAIVLALCVVGALAVVFVRRPEVFPILAFAALPFRIPVDTGGGDSANLLVPLYAVVAAGVAAYAWTRLRQPAHVAARNGRAWAGEEAKPRQVELAIVGVLLLYALQAGYSADFEQARQERRLLLRPVRAADEAADTGRVDEADRARAASGRPSGWR